MRTPQSRDIGAQSAHAQVVGVGDPRKDCERARHQSVCRGALIGMDELGNGQELPSGLGPPPRPRH